MKFLLDTNIFIWFTQGDEKLTDKDRGIIEKNSNEIFLSLVSVWEIAIKYSLGKLEIQRPFNDHIPGILIKKSHKSCISILPELIMSPISLSLEIFSLTYLVYSFKIL